MHPLLKKVATPRAEYEHLSHYYGDTVRRLFVTAAVVMIITTPFVADLLPVPAFMAVAVALALIVIASLTNPKESWSDTLNFIISIVALIVFQYQAIADYRTTDQGAMPLLLFVVEQILAIVFLSALYFSGKTFRSRIIA